MATKIVMAQLSPTMEEGKLVEWKVAEGDRVEASDVLAEIETDKANMDIEALSGGIIRKIVVPEGATVPVGSIIGIIAGPDEDISALLAEAEAGIPDVASEAATVPEVGVAPSEELQPMPGPAEAVPEPGPEPEGAAAVQEPAPGRATASPLARRLAAEAGLPLERIPGSGPGGRVVKRDVEAAVAAGIGAPQPETAAAAPGPAAPRQRAEERLELSQMRKAIARRLVQSIGPVPHFFLTSEIDMGRVLDLRAELNARLEEGKVGVNDLLIKVAAEALARHPEINASWEKEAIVRHGTVDIGIAVAVEDGLITPVLRDADRKGLLEISAESIRLIERARSRRLTPEEYQGATFSISNLGMFGIDEFTAIINPPEAAILAVGSTIEKPVASDGAVEIRRRMRVTLSCDHRVIDGATGARFLQTFRAMLENPLELMV